MGNLQDHIKQYYGKLHISTNKSTIKVACVSETQKKALENEKKLHILMEAMNASSSNDKLAQRPLQWDHSNYGMAEGIASNNNLTINANFIKFDHSFHVFRLL